MLGIAEYEDLRNIFITLPGTEKLHARPSLRIIVYTTVYTLLKSVFIPLFIHP